MDTLKEIFSHVEKRLLILIKWVVISVITAVIISLAGTIFYLLVKEATGIRGKYDFLILLLPFGGLIIAGMYRIFDGAGKQGTNLVLASIHSNKEIPIKMLPLIFISTILTHLFGGSAGREGAAIQIGGSIGNAFGKIFKFDDKDRHVVIMCGMSAAFTALFGTPMAAAVFSMEVVSVGIMHYAALVPCVAAALTSSAVAKYFGIMPECFNIGVIPEFNVLSATEIFFLAVLCAGVSVLFCIVLHKTEGLFRKHLRNHYIRIFVGGTIIVIFTFLLQTRDYNGAGMEVISNALSGDVKPEAFILKMLFTAVTLGAGFRGGEIVPSFFVGATFGCLFGKIVGLSPPLCAASGMIAVFCGVTNCPISSLLIGFEMFGMDGMPYYLITVAVSYMLSGYYGLYQSQKIIYSKYKSEYINTTAHK